MGERCVNICLYSVLAEVKSDLGSYYNAIARDLLQSANMSNNPDPEKALADGFRVRQKSIDGS